jgi:hypothetical protein
MLAAQPRRETELSYVGALFGAVLAVGINGVGILVLGHWGGHHPGAGLRVLTRVGQAYLSIWTMLAVIAFLRNVFPSKGTWYLAALDLESIRFGFLFVEGMIFLYPWLGWWMLDR